MAKQEPVSVVEQQRDKVTLKLNSKGVVQVEVTSVGEGTETKAAGKAAENEFDRLCKKYNV